MWKGPPNVNAEWLLDRVVQHQMAFAEGKAPEQVLAGVLDSLIAATQSVSGLLCHVHEEAGTLLVQALAVQAIEGESPLWSVRPGEFLSCELFCGLAERAVKEQEGQQIDIPVQVCGTEAVAPAPERKVACFPLVVGRRVVGLLGLADRPGGYPAELSRSVMPLNAIAAQLVIGVDDRRQRDLVKERLGAVVALAPDAIFTIDDDGRVLDANENARRWFGADVTGSSLASALGLVRLPVQGQALSCTVLDGIPKVFELSLGERVDTYPPFSVVVVRDVTEREAVKEALQDSENRWQHAISASTDGVWDWDLLTDHVFYSPRWLGMLGYGPSELPHHVSTFFRLMHPDDIPTVDVEVKRHIRGESEQYSVEFRLQHKDGTWRWILARGRILKFTEQGAPWHFMGTHVDITAQRHQEEQLRLARETAEAATRAKAAFLANMSHEIRTPMNAIVSTSHLLERTLLDGEQKEFLQLIQGASRGLLGIVNDVLDLSKIEAGSLSLEQVSFHLPELMSVVGRTHGLDANRRGLVLSVNIAPDVPLHVVGDPTRLQQVINNLLANAVKFTQAGRIDLQVEADPSGPYTLRFSIRDTGIGMSNLVIEKVFLPFQQAEESTTRRFGGTGLGLSISRHLVEMMGGHLVVESEEGQGSCFSFTLPFGQPASPISLALPVDGPSLRGRVLVVEDNPVNRTLTEQLLCRLTGCTVVTANDGQEAVNKAKEQVFDVILMDCQMPVMDGYAASMAIRRLPVPYSSVPIVALTANAFTEDRDRCIAMGMDDFLTKPVDLRRLLTVLKRWIGAHHDDA